MVVGLVGKDKSLSGDRHYGIKEGISTHGRGNRTPGTERRRGNAPCLPSVS
ncbi:hypothetical protein KKE26_06395 [bacterium]|nr:hypothetical protein [bacterium]